jgi:hypothetical protein
MQHLEHALDELVQLSTGREHRPASEAMRSSSMLAKDLSGRH